MIGFYNQGEWPRVPDLQLHNPITSNTYKSPPDSGQPPKPTETSSSEVSAQDDPLYHHDVPEYDPEHMPKIPDTTNKASDSHTTNYDPTRLALIIESRPVAVLPAILSQFIQNLPPAWVIRLAGSTESLAVVQQSSSLSRFIKSGKLDLQKIPDYYPVDSSERLSATLTNLTFYTEYVKSVEWLLMFQSDSMICSASDQSIDDWVDKGYSWVGAPWNMDTLGGNGGLSLRHVPSIVKVLEKETRPAGISIWEDRWFADKLDKLPPASITRTFSVESVYYERPLGYHLRGSGALLDPVIWRNETRVRQIFDYCPETKLIFQDLVKTW